MGSKNFERKTTVAIAIAVAASCANAVAQQTVRVSVDSAGAEGNKSSFDLAINANGHVVAFESEASNLVSGDTNNVRDIFVHDSVSGITERVSVDSSGAEANQDSGWFTNCALSDDGQIVAFGSQASNLVSGGTKYGRLHIYVHDRSTGVTELVSVDSSGVEANSDSWGVLAISADGQIVAFNSYASNLVPGDTNGNWDVFIHDRTTGITERVSVDSSGAEGNGDSGLQVAMSADGQIVAFDSVASNLVASDTNGVSDVFVHDRATGLTERVSIRTNGKEGRLASSDPSLSADGQIVAFASDSANLVNGDTNTVADIFVHDRKAQTTERVSVDSSGLQANLASYAFKARMLSADGQLVEFSSYATNLVANDFNALWDVFVHNRSTGITERVSVDSSGNEQNGNSYGSAISADGMFVAFDTVATNLVSGDTNGVSDVFVHELCSIAASWSNYGAGFPGTNGIPSFTSQQNPVLGTTITVDLANSYGNPTVGLLFLGFQRTSIHSVWGGDLLVVPLLTVPITFSYGGNSYTGSLPNDAQLCGVTVDLQAIEADPGAAKGVSFTAGLELLIGH